MVNGFNKNMHKQIPFGSRKIGEGAPVVVIAEIGINHEGDTGHCMRLIDEAASAGADAIKLQTVDADENYVPGTQSHKLFSKGYLSAEATAGAFNHAKSLGMEAFTVTGLRTFDWVERLEPAAYKISSSTLFHYPLLRRAALTSRSLLMSTGMAETSDIDDAVNWVQEYGAVNIGLFQCTSVYPASSDILDLLTIGFLQDRYGVPAGFSDHSMGSEASVLAVAAGASMIEKHFSLDPSRPDFDHHISLDPGQFRKMVTRIREAETMLGTREKRLVPDAADIARRMRRYLVAAVDVPLGHTLTADDIGVMRLGDGQVGLHPRYFDDLVGAIAKVSIKQFKPLLFEQIKQRAS